MNPYAQQQQPADKRTYFPLQRQFKGAGGGGAAPKVPAPPAPPPSSTAVEVTQAKRDTRRQEQRRTGISSTILAGETGGYGTDPAAKKTLLGG